MIRHAIKTRIAKMIETGSFQKFIRRIDKLVICALIFAVMFYPEKLQTFTIKDFDIYVGGFVIANLYAFFDKIISAIGYLRKNRPRFTIDLSDFQPKKQSINSNQNLIDGISQTELIDFLIKHKGFPFVLAKSKFGLFPKEYKKIGDNLERVGILVRGENNARILKDKIDREILEKIITKDNSNDLSLPLLQEGNSFTYQTI